MKPATVGLSAVLRQLRAFRGRSARSVAKAMGIPLRTYQLFESGHQRLQVDLIFRFAEALQADPYPVLLGVMLARPGPPGSCADNNLATALLLELKAFHETAGASTSSLRTTHLLKAFRAMFDGLALEAATERDAGRRLLAETNLKDGETPEEPTT